MLHPRVIRDLCRQPMWLIDHVEVTGDGHVTAVGWALPDNGDLMSGVVLMDGRMPDEFQRHRNEEIARAFPWHDNAEFAVFRAVWHDPGAHAREALHFSYVGRWTRIPYNRWQNVYFPLGAWLSGSYIRPEPARMVRTQGSDSVFSYVTYGATGAHLLDELTKTYFGKTLGEYKDICDWGSGCARVAQGVHRLAPGSVLTGLDIDQDNVEWCQRSVPFARFLTVPLLPPAPVADGQFDLLYGFSVFTHLAKDAFEAWRDEIHRLVRPGGVVLVTINRGGSLVQTTDEALILQTLATGFDDSRDDHALDKTISDGSFYRGTFLTTERALRIFGARFRVRDIVAQSGGGGQDMVVCERL